MGQPILCDLHQGEHAADVIVSQLATGDTFAACGAGWIDFCRLTVDQADAAERDATAAELEARMAGVTPPAGSDQAPDVPDEQDAAPVTEAAPAFPSSPASSGEAAPAPGRRSKHAGEAREGEADEQTAPAPIASPEPSQAPTEAVAEAATE